MDESSEPLFEIATVVFVILLPILTHIVILTLIVLRFKKVLSLKRKIGSLIQLVNPPVIGNTTDIPSLG